MSAFICGPDHFKALAIFAAQRRHGSLNADPRYIPGFDRLHGYGEMQLACAYANALYAENIRSVLHRYPDDTFESAPGLIEKPESIVITGMDIASNKYRLPAVAILKMCNCLEYQSCETEDYRTTPAFKLLESIKDSAIRLLPGYDDAPWDYEAGQRRAA